MAASDEATYPLALDFAYQQDARRIGENIAGGRARRPNDEDKLARALQRIQQGTYTELAQFRPAPDAGSRYGLACGDLDDFGRCAARYHDPRCINVIEGAAATSNARAASAWRDVLLSRTPDPSVVGLAYSSEPEPLSGLGTWDYLLRPEGGGRAEAELRARVLADMGEAGAPPPEPIQPRRDVRAIRAALGI